MSNDRFEYMAMNVSETQFESDIEADLLSNGYRKVDRVEYDKEAMLFPNVLVEFIKNIWFHLMVLKLEMVLIKLGLYGLRHLESDW